MKDQSDGVNHELILNNMSLADRKLHAQENLLAFICMAVAAFDILLLSPALVRIIQPFIARCDVDTLCALAELNVQFTSAELALVILLPVLLFAATYLSKDAAKIYRKYEVLNDAKRK